MSAVLTLLSAAEESTLALGRLLGRRLRPGQVVALYGDLGAGKTVLSRGIARGLGIQTAVTSPTFTV
ncbi:MAG: tRNA (adenosine(37)-N6)-threonylcarbamoyltransferase complex ATPase subunit type 1 TsaE, partial [Lentisphaerae bacterium]|nr:tRNA (adenosine(37)-N6)-threonylcarbamoyltransferase complex ATPase subunit type 1 TsaE [Lentisphaerota bacterium]